LFREVSAACELRPRHLQKLQWLDDTFAHTTFHVVPEGQYVSVANSHRAPDIMIHMIGNPPNTAQVYWWFKQSRLTGGSHKRKNRKQMA
jgi:hypothetical protein